MKKICIVTTARSEYGMLKWLIHDIHQSDRFEMQLVVGGGHLMKEQGHTIDEIRKDNIPISYIVETPMDVSDTKHIVETMGHFSIGFAEAFDVLKPDYLLVLGDRYELLPICSAALLMEIPIIHLSGGDKTEGALDDEIRNAVTMMATYHFPGTVESAGNIERMRGSNKNIWAVGEPGLDALFREQLMSREELADNLGLEPQKKWGLMTYHAQTKESVEFNLEVVKQCIENLVSIKDYQTVITYANADQGGMRINSYIEEQAKLFPESILAIPSLGHRRYLSYMRQVEFVIGNSSSGIVEAPTLGIKVINIGDRQKGRHQCGNVYQCEPTKEAIHEAIHTIQEKSVADYKDRDYWGDGHTSEHIVKILEDELA